ncbi:dienelactone hydrolase family protein [Nonomuraea soli]|uniref:Carboxymethylenebutenolidase n=1 Tax=Nonomuraea soli TaxID=1032476 RepID=A0A7W0CCY8_9ACTN|nr:dienelactone hydrolase family protein [Nonomuraea soli]MBA2888725.1 carboxymethylenebutenolidase [Nonomuraea soli]
MCHSPDSRPPAPPVVGEVAEHGETTLTSADGTTFLAYRAVPAEPNGRGVVIFPDVRGLHPFYRDLAVRYAEAGFHAVAIDYFGRTAGTGERGDDFDYLPHVRQVTDEQLDADARAAAATLPGPVFVVGFCFGGAHAWRVAASVEGFAGGVGYYGSLRFIDGWEPKGPGSPVLMLLGGADRGATPEQFAALRSSLERAGIEVEQHVYEGAPHSFFDRSATEWAEACADSWRRILAFTSRHG